jgi:hypothetical protein
VATGPAGHPSGSWLPKTPVPGVVVEARFSAKDCTPCPHRARCRTACVGVSTPQSGLHAVSTPCPMDPIQTGTAYHRLTTPRSV